MAQQIDRLDLRSAGLEHALCREDLAAFIEKTFKIVTPGVQYHHSWHIECIAEYLTACYRREIKRLIINIPPRSLKSVSSSVAFPAWLLGKDPSTRIMCASYAKSLSLKHSVDCRLVMESEWYKQCFPKTRITSDNNQKTYYITTERGYRLATSTGAATTGEGGNFLIVDDPHNAQEAQSKIIREGQINWFDQSFSTRLNDKENDVIIVIMQRLHNQDLTGHLLELGGWEHLCLPAIFEEKKIISIGRFQKVVKPGEILHPQRENKKVLEATKIQMGDYAFAGQYMQTPTPDGGGIFKRDSIKLYPADKALPKFDCIIQSYDTALSESTTADYSAFQAWGIFEQDHDKGKAAMLLDAWQERLAYPDLKKKMRNEYQNTRYGDGEGRRADIVLIENKGSGISLIQDLQRQGVPIRAYNPGKADKIQRAHLVTYLFDAGLVFFPESKATRSKTYNWADQVIQQLVSFPNDEHDDHVDTLTQVLRYFRDASWLKVSSDPDEEVEEKLPVVNPYAR